MKAVFYAPRAVKSLRRQRAASARIRDAIARYAATGAGDVKALRGGDGLARLRVGDWRVIFIEGETRIDVIAIGPRGAIYD